MSVQVDIQVDQRSVYELLDRMDTGFSATAWAGFLVSTVGPYLAERAEMRFAKEGDDVSGKWAPLKESTKALRLEQGFPEGPINHRTGEMERYITGGFGAAIPLGPVALLTFPNPASPMNAELQEKVKTAQTGKTKPSTVPRPVLGLNATDAMFVVAAMSFYAREVIAGRPTP